MLRIFSIPPSAEPGKKRRLIQLLVKIKTDIAIFFLTISIMLHSEQNVKVCDATPAHSSKAAGIIKKYLRPLYLIPYTLYLTPYTLSLTPSN
jgi:hypothetical protein